MRLRKPDGIDRIAVGVFIEREGTLQFSGHDKTAIENGPSTRQPSSPHILEIRIALGRKKECLGTQNPHGGPHACLPLDALVSDL